MRLCAYARWPADRWRCGRNDRPHDPGRHVWMGLPSPSSRVGSTGLHIIWDLGSNVGYTVAHLAHLFPGARIVGVELDVDNAAVARLNIAPWSDRCDLIHAAVWTEDGTLGYRRVAGQEYGLRVAPLMDAISEPNATAPAISLNTLLLREPSRQIDYVKMDIEGAESRVLRENTEWAASVRAIKVEIHPPYSMSDCSTDLQELGLPDHRRYQAPCLRHRPSSDHRMMPWCCRAASVRSNIEHPHYPSRGLNQRRDE